MVGVQGGGGGCIDDDQPVKTSLRTRESMGSWSVHVLICGVCMTDSAKWFSSNLMSAGIGTNLGVSGNGNLLKASAFANWVPGLCLIV